MWKFKGVNIQVLRTREQRCCFSEGRSKLSITNTLRGFPPSLQDLRQNQKRTRARRRRASVEKFCRTQVLQKRKLATRESITLVLSATNITHVQISKFNEKLKLITTIGRSTLSIPTWLISATNRAYSRKSTQTPSLQIYSGIPAINSKQPSRPTVMIASPRVLVANPPSQ